VSEPQPNGPVLVVGTGLIGTSIGLALRSRGVQVHLADTDGDRLAAAVARGAGTDARPDDVSLVVVAVPPAALGESITAALAAWPTAVVCDVGSIKALPLEQVTAGGADTSRYVGSHPMAGSERSGPQAADAALFSGRAWAVTPHPDSASDAIDAVRALADSCDASVVEMSPAEHDAAVARVSHLPYVVSVLAAAQLLPAPASHLALSGQGLRDVTRVAGSDPELWQQILVGNAAQLRLLLADLRDDIDGLIAALPGERSGAESFELLDRGRRGTRLIPGKHGAPWTERSVISVQVPDRPGELARLLADAGQSGVNVEDLRIDHDPARCVGIVEVVVHVDAAESFARWLESSGWSVHK